MVVGEAAARALASFTSDPQGLGHRPAGGWCRASPARPRWCGCAPACSPPVTPGREIRVTPSTSWRATPPRASWPTPSPRTPPCWSGAGPSRRRRRCPGEGDVEVLVVDVLNEGTGLVQRLLQSDVDAVDVPAGRARRRRGRGRSGGARGRRRRPRRSSWPRAASRAAAAVARASGYFGVAGRRRGSPLPERMWQPVRDSVLTDETWDADDEAVPSTWSTASSGPSVPSRWPTPSGASTARSPSSCSRATSSDGCGCSSTPTGASTTPALWRALGRARRRPRRRHHRARQHRRGDRGGQRVPHPRGGRPARHPGGGRRRGGLFGRPLRDAPGGLHPRGRRHRRHRCRPQGTARSPRKAPTPCSPAWWRSPTSRSRS